MPRQAKGQRVGVIKPDDLLEAEKAGQELLNNFCRAKYGNQTLLARSSGLLVATISRMAGGSTPINFEAAVMIDVATNGKLSAEKLCPGCADLVAQFLQLRATKASE